MIFKKIWYKFFNKNKYGKFKFLHKQKIKEDIFEKKVKNYLNKVDNCLTSKSEISFLHSGHLGDLTNALPVIKEISKTKKCNYFIEPNKKIPLHVRNDLHPFGNYYLNINSVNMILPLLKRQPYLNIVDIYNGQKIDIDLNFFRELPINFNIDSVRWYSHLTGTHPNLSDPYIEVDDNNSLKNKIIIIRNSRRKNSLINYKFLNKYNDIFFLGLKNEFDDLKKEVKNLNFYNCKNFLEMAEIIKNSKIFIGNLSFGYTLAEGLKVQRLLESNPEFPLVYPNGGKGYDFYFQNHFENLFSKLYDFNKKI